MIAAAAIRGLGEGRSMSPLLSSPDFSADRFGRLIAQGCLELSDVPPGIRPIVASWLQARDEALTAFRDAVMPLFRTVPLFSVLDLLHKQGARKGSPLSKREAEVEVIKIYRYAGRVHHAARRAAGGAS